LGALLHQRCRSTSDPTEPPPYPPGSLALWMLLFLFFVLLSIGDSPESKLFESPDWLLLPFHWLKRFSLFGLVRLPNRFLIPAVLSLSVVVAMGAACLVRFLRPERRSITLGALAMLLLFDYAWLPYPMRELPRQNWLAALAELPPNLAVFDIPSSYRGGGSFDMYSQTLHERPILGGSISVNPPTTRRRFEAYPQLRRVFKPFRNGPGDAAYPRLARSISEIGADIVVVHLDRTREREAEARMSLSRDAPNFLFRDRQYDPRSEMSEAQLRNIRQELRDAFGPPIHQSDEVEIYLVPPVPGLQDAS